MKSKKNFEITKLIDSGNCGSVSKIKVHEDQKEYAVKQIDFNKLDEKEKPFALEEFPAKWHDTNFFPNI